MSMASAISIAEKFQFLYRVRVLKSDMEFDEGVDNWFQSLYRVRVLKCIS